MKIPTEIADALTADEARQCIAYFLDAVYRLDETGDRQQFVADMKRAVGVTELASDTVPQQTIKAGQWPAAAREMALSLLPEVGPREAARRVSAEYGRPCSHTMVRVWGRAA